MKKRYTAFLLSALVMMSTQTLPLSYAEGDKKPCPHVSNAENCETSDKCTPSHHHDSNPNHHHDADPSHHHDDDPTHHHDTDPSHHHDADPSHHHDEDPAHHHDTDPNHHHD